VVIATLALLAGGAAPAAGAPIVQDGGFVIHGPASDFERSVDLAVAAGAPWISTGYPWEALEPERDAHLNAAGAGAGAWQDLEDRVSYAKARGLRVALTITNAPGWASGISGVSNDPPTPGNHAAYGAFLAYLAQRLGPWIDAYSPWNEPNITRFWNPVDPEAYTAVQKLAYPAIKSSDPTATVLSAAIVGRFSGQNSGYSFLRRAYQAGLRGHADAIAWNGYPGGPPESSSPVDGGIPAANTLPGQLYLRDLINEFDPGRRVWIMEMSWSTCIPCNVSAANGVTEAQQADYLTRMYEFRRRYLDGFTERIFWFDFRDAGPNRTDWESSHGVVRTDHSPKPAYFAFTALGTEPGSAGAGATPGAGPAADGAQPIPPAATRINLPVAARSGTARIAIGRPRLVARGGRMTLSVPMTVAGGRSRVRIEGFRGGRWHLVATFGLTRSGRITVRFTDRAYVSIRIRATLPGASGWRAGRIVLFRTPARGRVIPLRPGPLGLPAVARSPRAHVAVGRPRLVALAGRRTLSVPISVSGGRSRVRIDGFRGGAWRTVTTRIVSRSERVGTRMPRGTVARLRIRATLPGARGWRAGRLALVTTQRALGTR
jgi:hypothetical protein